MTQKEKILEHIRNVCGLKRLRFGCVELNHLLWAVNEDDYTYVLATDGHILKMLYSNELGSMTYEGTGIYYDLQKSVSENLNNSALCAFIGELLGIEEDAIS